jgi:hypothetical protein
MKNQRNSGPTDGALMLARMQLFQWIQDNEASRKAANRMEVLGIRAAAARTARRNAADPSKGDGAS